jgi:hypothetical protein
LKKYQGANREHKGGHFPLDAIYMTPDSPHQLAMMPDISAEVELETGVDALYVTRLQRERMEKKDGVSEEYPTVDKKFLKGKAFKRTMVMHPLPRVDELACEMDADPRSMYFKQAERGVPIRMALIALLLGTKEAELREETSPFRKKEFPVYSREYGLRCSNPRCVSIQQTETKYIKPGFEVIATEPLILRCVYCEHETQPTYVASTEWHEGRVETKKYHLASSHWAKTIKPENLIIFGSQSDAEAQGFRPSHFTGERH